MQSKTELGQVGEDLAVQALQAHGYLVHERNWRCRYGEIDIIAEDRDIWVVVEVKLRTSDTFGSPEEAVDARKQNRLLQLGQAYAADRGLLDRKWRVDVVAVRMGAREKVESIQIFRDAVRGNE